MKTGAETKTAMQRMASAYLCFAPILIVAPLYFIYHHLGLYAGICGAIVCLGLTGWAMWARGLLESVQVMTSIGFARLLLVGGGAIVWVMGAAGPPRRADATLALYNNFGLCVGMFVIVSGLAVLKTELEKEKKGSLATVGYAAVSLAYVMWILQCCFIWSSLPVPAAGLPDAQQPEWLRFFDPAWEHVDRFRVVSTYLADGLYVSAGILTKRLAPWPGRVLLTFSILGIGFGVPDVGPFFIPALTCIVPYFLGLTIRNVSIGSTHPA